MVIDRDMQTLPANALVDIHVPRAARDAVADAGDPSELLRVEVQQIAGARVFVAVHQWRGFQPPAPGQARAPRDAGGRRRAHADGPGDLRARPPLVAQDFNPELDGRGRGLRAGVGPAGAVLQPGHPFRAIAGQPLARGPERHSKLRGQSSHRLAARGPRHQVLSTVGRESGILVDVHPGLLFPGKC
jgi:hypothetical protein